MSNKRQMKKLTAKERSKRNVKKERARARREQQREQMGEFVSGLEIQERARAINIEIAQPGDLIGLDQRIERP